MTANRFDIAFAPAGARRRGVAFAVSAAVHVVLIWLAARHAPELFTKTPAPGAPTLLVFPGGGGGGGGGSDVRYITLPPAPAVPAKAPPVEHVPAPTVTPDPIPVEPSPTVSVTPDTVSSVAIDSADTGSADTVAASAGGATSGTGPGAGGGQGGGQGGGVGPGAGPGSGPGAGGQGGAIAPPIWSGGAFPFDSPPKALRGQRIQITFWVRADGTLDRVETQPVIADREYAAKFAQVTQTFRFKPARAPDGRAVPGTLTMTITLPTK